MKVPKRRQIGPSSVGMFLGNQYHTVTHRALPYKRLDAQDHHRAGGEISNFPMRLQDADLGGMALHIIVKWDRAGQSLRPTGNRRR